MPQPAAAPTATGERLGRWLLALALVLAVTAAVDGLFDPWENGLRGQNAAAYEDVFVRNFLTYGLGVTHAAPAFAYEVDGHPVCEWHWHHPALYPLYLTAWAWVLGQHEWVLRLAHLLLFLPGIAALYDLLRRTLRPTLAGIACVLFAAVPMVSYFGPMVVHDGAVLSLGLCSAALFWRWLEQPGRGRLALAATAFFVTTQLDFLGHLWGLALVLLTLASPRRRDGLRALALLLFPLSLLSLVLVSLHYSPILGGPLGLMRGMLRVTGTANGDAPSGTELLATLRQVLFDYGALPLCALALLGLGAAACRALPQRARSLWLALTLAVPGTLACLLSLRHVADHAFWPMPVFAGVAVAASVLPALGLDWLLQHRRQRPAALLLALALAVVGHGVWSVHALVARFRPSDLAFSAMVQEASGLCDGCAIALTNRNVPMRAWLEGQPGLLFLGNVTTAGLLDQWLDYGRGRGVRGELAFVLVRGTAVPELVARLEQLATPIEREHVVVYRWRL